MFLMKILSLRNRQICNLMLKFKAKMNKIILLKNKIKMQIMNLNNSKIQWMIFSKKR